MGQIGQISTESPKSPGTVPRTSGNQLSLGSIPELGMLGEMAHKVRKNEVSKVRKKRCKAQGWEKEVQG